MNEYSTALDINWSWAQHRFSIPYEQAAILHKYLKHHPDDAEAEALFDKKIDFMQKAHDEMVAIMRKAEESGIDLEHPEWFDTIHEIMERYRGYQASREVESSYTPQIFKKA